jgi:uncharacterized protein (DUF4415 family)
MTTATDHDDDSPEWTEEMFARAKPAKEVLPPKLYEALTRKPGRPKKEAAKLPVSLRLDPDVVAAYKAGGAGWQTRMGQVLRDAILPAPAVSAAAPRSPLKRGRDQGKPAR